MKRLKTIIQFFCVGLVSVSCAFHSGNISSAPQGADFQYVSIAVGEAKSHKIFAIGGINRDALVQEAKSEMMRNRPLKAGEAYANVSVDTKRSYYLIYWQTKVSVSADIIKIGKTNERYSSTYPLLPSNPENYQNQFFAIADTVFSQSGEAYILSGFLGDEVLLRQFNQSALKKMKFSELRLNPSIWLKNNAKTAPFKNATFTSDLFQPLDTVLDVFGQTYVLLQQDGESMLAIQTKTGKNEELKAVAPTNLKLINIFSIKVKQYKGYAIGDAIQLNSENAFITGFGIEGVLVVDKDGGFGIVKYDKIIKP